MFVCTECGGPQPTEGHCPADGTPLVPIGEDVLLGTTIGAYRVAMLLGIGGMGRVYKGVHPTIGSRVAIKVLSRECTDRRDLVDRFFAEARAVNLIRHESIVNVLDLATLPDGRPYIIMEYLDGAPLAAIVDHAQAHQLPLPLGGLARLAVEVLDALSAAHAKGIVHRDLKPDNIYVAPSGRPKVLDFGIAKLTDPNANSSTRTGSLLGTPHYMSPEQAAGRPVDHRADLYAIGVILYECVTGRKLFVADSLFDLLRKHVEEPPVPPRTYRPDLDPGLEALILCALAKLPEQRFATAQAMSLALQHATAHLPPEQWTPITASGTHRVAIPSWNRQPPATWSSRVQRVDDGRPPRGLPRPSEQPFDNYLGQSTVSASSGQVQKQSPAKPKSRRGLWLALAGVAVIGGIVAVAVMTNGDERAVVVANTPAPPPDKPTPPADNPAPTPAAPTPDPEPPVRSAVGSDAPNSVDSTAAPKPGVRPDPTPTPRPDPKPAPVVEASDDDEDVPAKPGTPRKAWIENRALLVPNWNPSRVDITAFIKLAIAEAKKAMPDAILTRVDVSGVTPDGYANLTLPTLASKHGDIDLRFISPSASKPDPKTPVGVPSDRLCEFRIMGSPDGVEITSMFKTNCKTKTVPVPTCSYAALWKFALASGGPSNAVANIGYYSASMHDSPRWFFDIGFGHDVVFSKMWKGPGCPG
ncbi:MAG: serine/threonine protein kinase [Deltaproteobacteria bacterium]|nr:serine/threonine protein kinase [Deltaproteobacteria bacterium]